MEFVDGIELLYSEYYSNLVIKIFTWVFAISCAILTILAIYFIIKDAAWELFWIPVLGVGAGVFITTVMLSISSAYTIYHIKIDDTVPYAYIQENYPGIRHEGGDVYELYIDEE